MILGIDLGTSSIKGILADTKGNILDSASCSYDVHYIDNFGSEQNPEDWYRGFAIIIKKLGERHDLKKIEGISFSGQMHGLVILDEEDKVIREAILWNDGRTAEECKYLNEVVKKECLISYTGNMALTGFTAPKLLWLKNNEPDNFKKIRKIMLPKDYLIYKLTNIHGSDVSDLSGTLFFDVKNKIYSKEMLEILSINEDMLPKIFESYEIVGNITTEAAEELGFSQELKVVAGGGDQAMAAIGTGTIENNSLSINLGTSGVVFSSLEEFFFDEEASLHSFCHANGKYHVMGVTLSCAASTKWYVEDILKTTDYESVLNNISKREITDILYLPYLNGERSPINNPLALGTIHNLRGSNGRDDLTKAIIEGICFSLRDCINVVREKHNIATKARVIGGGSKSDDFLQILSDVLNVEITRINTAEGGGLGAVILTMYALGYVESIKEACDSLIKEVDTFVPDSKNVLIYNEKFEKYKELYYKLNNYQTSYM